MTGPNSRIKVEYLERNIWRASVLCYSGKIAAVEGELPRIARLAARADRLFAVWAKSNSRLETVPPPTHTIHPRLARS